MRDGSRPVRHGRCSQAEAPIPTEIESPAGFTTPTFDGRGLREPFARSSGRVGPRYPVLVHRAAALAPRFLQTPSRAMTPSRFANPSPPSGWIEDLPPPSCRSYSAHKAKARAVSPGLDFAEAVRPGGGVETQATFLKTLPKLSLTGSAESVATFCAIAASSLD